MSAADHARWAERITRARAQVRPFAWIKVYCENGINVWVNRDRTRGFMVKRGDTHVYLATLTQVIQLVEHCDWSNSPDSRVNFSDDDTRICDWSYPTEVQDGSSPTFVFGDRYRMGILDPDAGTVILASLRTMSLDRYTLDSDSILDFIRKNGAVPSRA